MRRRLLAIADMVAATAALVVVLNVFGADRVAVAALAALPLFVLVCKIAGLYDHDQLRLVHSTLDEVPTLLQLSAFFALGVTIFQPIVLDGGVGGGQVAALWLGTFAAILGARVVARALADRVSPVERCLVIGERERAERVRERLVASRAHAQIVATVPLPGEGFDGLGTERAIRELVEEVEIHRIVIAPTTTDSGDVVHLVRLARSVGVRVSLLPRMFEVVGSSVAFDDVEGLTVLGIRPFGLSTSSQRLKRAFDLLVTSVGLLAVTPIMAAIAVAIRLDSRGPVFYRQTRIGREGRPFEMLKFRSMVDGAEAQKDQLLGLNEAGDGMFKLARDPRVTRVGDVLRRTSLDELPQLLNVLRGEMSLVGPRPLVGDEDARVLGLDRSRSRLVPGMTGPWQVGTRVPMREMVGIDYLYATNWSLWLDLKLMLRTVRHVFRGANV